VWGDGVCPEQIALLPGAERLVLPRVWHSPQAVPGRLWYGSPQVVEQWAQYISAAPLGAGWAGEPQ
jgi:hypothetical protein